MRVLEREILAWFIERHGAAYPELKAQLEAVVRLSPAFTAGAGAFISLEVPSALPRCKIVGTYIDGPELRSPEMTSGALVSLHLSEGAASSIEIWSYAGDYPEDRHPSEFAFVEPQVNEVYLRGGL